MYFPVPIELKVIPIHYIKYEFSLLFMIHRVLVKGKLMAEVV